MDKKLDLYLQTLEIELGSLETEQRASELREMRQHIEAIVARLIEGGLSEGEAAEAAIEQFDAARNVGRELKRVSRERDSWWRIVLAAGSAIETHNWLVSTFQHANGWTADLGWVAPLLYAFFPVIAGFIAGIVGRTWNERILAGLCVAASALYSGSWFNWPLSSLSLLFLIFTGAFFGSRWNLRFSLDIERKEPTRA